MDLSQLDPRIWFAKIAWYLLTAVLCLITGFFGGCQYKQNQWDADNFRKMEKTQKLERSDAVAGTKASAEFKQDRKQAGEGKDFVRQELSKGKPLVRIVNPTPAPKESLDVKTKPGTIKDEKSGIYLTAVFMQLYDVSIEPGNIELRSRSYEGAYEPTLDEGFAKVIRLNNQDCADQRLQLSKLIARIKEKQKLFQPDKGIF